VKRFRPSLFLGLSLLVAGWLGCSSGDAPPAPTPTPPAPELPETPAQTGAQRLSVAQYRGSILAILGDDIVIPTALEPDQAQGGFIAVGASYSTISARGIEQYEKAAYAIAKQALAPERRDRLVSCKPAGVSDEGCARSTLEALGRKVWRRPLASEELDALVGVSGKAATTLGDFFEGLQYGVAALLQSPNFLYRSAEGEADPNNPGKRRYTSHEMASRLSFFLWNRTPDDELLDAAQAGALVEEAGLRQQVERLLAAPQAREGARNFFHEYLGLSELSHLSKDPTIFTYYSPEVGPMAREETLRLFEHFVFDLDADYRDLFTTRTTFVNPKLASMYAIPAPNLAGFGKTEHPEDSPRRGLLGHISLLASHAHPVSSSATLRGRFIRSRLLCFKIPDPPANANTALPEPSPELPTLRQRIQKHLTDPGCSSCHLSMDPLGLALEQFDGLGRFRRRENNVEIDPSSELDGVPVKDARALGEAIRNHPDLTPCLVRNLYRYATAFPEASDDEKTIEALTHEFRATGHKIRSLLLAVALSPAFRLAQEPRLCPSDSLAAPSSAGFSAAPRSPSASLCWRSSSTVTATRSPPEARCPGASASSSGGTASWRPAGRRRRKAPAGSPRRSSPRWRTCAARSPWSAG
jgi:hypothetical protein